MNRAENKRQDRRSLTIKADYIDNMLRGMMDALHYLQTDTPYPNSDVNNFIPCNIEAFMKLIIDNCKD